MDKLFPPYLEWEILREPVTISKVEDTSELPKGKNKIRTNRECAVDVIFQMMKQHPVEPDKNEFSSIVSALGKDQLYKENKKMINENLDSFLRSKDERLIKLAIVIRKRIT